MTTWTPSALQRARDDYRRGRARRSLLIAAASTVAVGAGLYLVITSSPGWPRVQETFFNMRIAWTSLPSVAIGFWLNIRVFTVSAVLMLVFGLLLAVLRTLRGPVFWPVRALATCYVELFRAVPLILVLLLVGFGVPGLRLRGVPSSAVVLGSLALVLTYSAYVAEVFRAGIESVHPSQRAAARSLGLTAGQTMRHVVLPQAVRNVIPPLLNDVVSLTKDSGLISILGIPIDAVRSAQIVTAETFNFTPYLVAGVLFVLLTIPLSRFTDALSRRHGFIPGGSHL